MESKNLAVLGREYVHTHALKAVRDRYGFSRTTQAHMIGVSPTALRDWELSVSLSRVSAERIAKWYLEVEAFTRGADKLLLRAVERGRLLHVTVASQVLAMSWGTITEKCQSGVLRCVDLGPLGTYVHADDLEHVHAHRQP